MRRFTRLRMRRYTRRRVCSIWQSVCQRPPPFDGSMCCLLSLSSSAKLRLPEAITPCSKMCTLNTYVCTMCTRTVCSMCTRTPPTGDSELNNPNAHCIIAHAHHNVDAHTPHAGSLLDSPHAQCAVCMHAMTWMRSAQGIPTRDPNGIPQGPPFEFPKGLHRDPPMES